MLLPFYEKRHLSIRIRTTIMQKLTKDYKYAILTVIVTVAVIATCEQLISYR